MAKKYSLGNGESSGKLPLGLAYGCYLVKMKKITYLASLTFRKVFGNISTVFHGA